MASRSVLCPLLPEATIYYLDQYGADKYAEVFLSEFENPEIIWNSEMRFNIYIYIYFLDIFFTSLGII